MNLEEFELMTQLAERLSTINKRLTMIVTSVPSLEVALFEVRSELTDITHKLLQTQETS